MTVYYEIAIVHAHGHVHLMESTPTFFHSYPYHSPTTVACHAASFFLLHIDNHIDAFGYNLCHEFSTSKKNLLTNIFESCPTKKAS